MLVRSLLLLFLVAVPAFGQKKPRVTVGKETTVLTEPLDEDGYVDYVKAIDARLRKGVTPENNANVRIRLLLGDRELSRRTSLTYYERLGIKPPEDSNAIVVSMGAIQQELGHPNELNAALRKPWTETTSPTAGIWMNRNRDQLVKIREAVTKPRYYSPLMTQESRVFSVLLPDVQNTRILARVLLADAMLNLGRGKEGVVMDDLVATHRLASHIGNSWTLVELLVSFAIRNMAYDAEESFLNAARPNRGKQVFWQRKLKTVRSQKSMAELVRTTERYMALDAICAVARGEDINTMLTLVGREKISAAKAAVLALRIKSPKLDFDEILRECNRTYDLIGKAFDPESTNQEKPSDLVRQKKAAWEKTVQETTVAELTFDNRKLQRYVLSLMLSNLTPFLETAQKAEELCAARGECLKVAWAVSAWYAKHKSYPEKLDQLVPLYLKELPADRFTGESLIYKVAGGRCRVYSFGPNAKDDDYKKRSDDANDFDVGVELIR